MRKLINYYLCRTPRCFRLRTHGDYCALCFIAKTLSATALKTQVPFETSDNAAASSLNDKKKAQCNDDGGIFIPNISTDSHGQAVEAKVTQARSGDVNAAVDALRALKKGK